MRQPKGLNSARAFQAQNSYWLSFINLLKIYQYSFHTVSVYRFAPENTDATDETDPTSFNIVESNRTMWNELAKRMQHVGFNTWNQEVWVQNLPTILRKQTRAIFVCTKSGARSIHCKEMFSCYCSVKMLEEEDDRVPKRGKTRHWIKRLFCS